VAPRTALFRHANGGRFGGTVAVRLVALATHCRQDSDWDLRHMFGRMHARRPTSARWSRDFGASALRLDNSEKGLLHPGSQAIGSSVVHWIVVCRASPSDLVRFVPSAAYLLFDVGNVLLRNP